MTAKGSNAGRWLMAALSTVLVAALILVLVQNYFKVTDCNNREGETKQNLHTIQLALDRYSVDYDDHYPLWLSGGECAEARNKAIDDQYLPVPLMAEGYMPTYPRNPFRRSIKADYADPLLLMQKNHA